MAHLTNDQVFKFIKLYRMWPLIWDPKHSQRNDRNKINEAWVRISDAMGVDIADLKWKKEKLMGTYRVLKKKKKNTISGEVWPFYDALNSFLGNIESNATRLSITYENIPKETEESWFEPNRTPPNTPPSKRKPSCDVEVVEVEKQRKLSYHANPSIQKPLYAKEVDDECELYGKLLVAKLKKFPENERMEVMLAIDSFIIEHTRNVRTREPAPSPSFPQLQTKTKSMLRTERNRSAGHRSDHLNACALETFINADMD